MEARRSPDRHEHACSMDSDGFLASPREWREEVARTLARGDRLELTEPHWTVIRFLRRHHERANTVPTMREVREGTGYSTRELFDLFPAGGPLMQGVKIAGLPKPTGCK